MRVLDLRDPALVEAGLDGEFWPGTNRGGYVGEDVVGSSAGQSGEFSHCA